MLPSADTPEENGPTLLEAGIAKTPAGRLPDQARAEAEAAYRRAPRGTVHRVGPDTPLSAVNALDIAPGDTVLFQRGGVWRGQLRVCSGVPGHPVRYGAYGTGPAPVLQPSLDASGADRWSPVGDGLWRVETGSRCDIGNILPDGGEDGCLFKRGSLAELLRDGDFFFDPEDGRVTVRSERGNPGARWRSIELAVKRHAIDEASAHDVLYEGLALRFGAAHGIGGGGASRIAVLGCDISWIGGGYLYRDDLGNGVRYGNGIELWGGAEDIRVEGCRVRQCWDAGLTNQSNEEGSRQRNILWKGNTVRECEYSYEFWQQGDEASAEDVRLQDNVFCDAGGGWSHAQRWNPNAAHLMFYDTTVPTSGFAVLGNRFSRSADCLARLFNDWRGQAAFSGNVWESGGEPLCRYHARPRSGLRFLYPDRLDRIHSDDPAEIEAQGSGGRLFPATPDGLRLFQDAFAFGPDELLRTPSEAPGLSR